MQVLCPYGPWNSKPREKSELHKQQYSVTLFDCSHLAHVIGLWQMQEFMCHCTSFVLFCFIFNLRAISKYKAPGAYIWRGDITEGFLRYDFGGLIFEVAYTWRGLFSEFEGTFSIF